MHQLRALAGRIPYPAAARRLALTASLAIGALASSISPASGQSIHTQYNSLSCVFWGEATIDYSQSLARAATNRVSSCADYAAVGYQYYLGGQWFGTYYDWCYTSYQYSCFKENYAGATQVSTYHQIFTQGFWRQWEYGYASG